MSFTHTIEQSVSTTGKKISGSFPITDAQEQLLDHVVAPSVTDQQVDTFDIIVARLKSLVILSDQDVTIEINSSAGSGGTLAIKANKPLIWYTGSYFANPLGVDVTALFFTTGAIPASANVQIAALVDPTP